MNRVEAAAKEMGLLHTLTIYTGAVVSSFPEASHERTSRKEVDSLIKKRWCVEGELCRDVNDFDLARAGQAIGINITGPYASISLSVCWVTSYQNLMVLSLWYDELGPGYEKDVGKE